MRRPRRYRESMSRRTRPPLPLLRLAFYLLVVSICGYVAVREFSVRLSSNLTTGAVLSVGTSSQSLRSARYWAEYEYHDTEQLRHTGRADGVHPATRAGELVTVEYLRRDPTTSRLAPPRGMGPIFGAVALLAAVVMGLEIWTWRRKRQRRHRDDQDNSATSARHGG